MAKNHLILPVIHVGPNGAAEAIANASLADDEGAHGVFIINHGYSEDLVALAKKVKSVTGGWVGVNWLGVETHKVLKLANGLDALWADDAAINEEVGEEDQSYPEYVKLVRDAYAPDVKLFLGTAFKYQRHVANVKRAASLASKFMDYVCTSGPGTGESADVSKIKMMAEGAAKPLAIASGITQDNVQNYLPYAEAFLVATGISSDFYNLDREKLRQLIDKVKSYDISKETK